MHPTLALVGDYSEAVVAHRAIPSALAAAARELGAPIEWRWLATADIGRAEDLRAFAGIWVVPGSPYASMSGALTAIRFARETRRPFLGTCGGFQHALIEIARDVAGISTADHAETNPGGENLVVTRLACSLVEQAEVLRFLPGSLIEAAYGTGTAVEGYRCNYGLNPGFSSALTGAGLRFTAFDAHDEIRAAELSPDAHPFFVGTLFQPERAALRGETPPLVRAFVRAIISP